MTKLPRIQHPFRSAPGTARSRQNGFTLVEVMLALGIVSFALVALMGMLPFGLGVSRRAIDQTVGAQIAQDLTDMVQRTPFASLSNFGNARTGEVAGGTASFYYYDAEGTLLAAVPSSTGGGGGATTTPPLNPVYRVQLYVAPDSELTQLLGSGQAGSTLWSGALSNVKAVHIDLRNLSMPPNEERKLITYVANSGF